MAQEPAERGRDPWIPWFILSITTASLSFVVLAIVLFDLTAEGNAQAGTQSEDEATPSVERGLTYAGTLPPGAEKLGLRAAAAGKTADIEFASGDGDGAVSTRFFVPVSALGAGVDSLTGAELRGLWDGSIGDWSEVGGVEGPVRLAVAEPATERALSALGPELPAGVEDLAGYAELRHKMALDSGILAFVALEELGPAMVAIAVDGMDIARGIGDPAKWPFAERVQIVARTERGRDALEAVQAAIAAKAPEAIRVVATGDVLQSRCTLAKIQAAGDWAAALRGPVAEYLAVADLALSSLDGSIQGIGTPSGCIQTTNLTSPPEVIEALTVAGIDEMTVATNHAFDCGEAACGSKALLESITRLNGAGIRTVGGGKNLEEALAPAIFEVRGVTFGVLGFDDIAAEDLQATETEAGTAPLDDSYEDEKADLPAEPAFYKSADLLELTRLTERIRALKRQVDVVIVQIQSGTEDTHDPSPRSIKALRAAADAGADLVVGNQAHWVQAVEVRDGTFVAYALGNFVFDQTHTPEHTQGYLLEATFHGAKLATVKFVPYQIEEKYRPVFVFGATRAKVLGDVAKASIRLPEAD